MPKALHDLTPETTDISNPETTVQGVQHLINFGLGHGIDNDPCIESAIDAAWAITGIDIYIEPFQHRYIPSQEWARWTDLGNRGFYHKGAAGFDLGPFWKEFYRVLRLSGWRAAPGCSLHLRQKRQ